MIPMPGKVGRPVGVRYISHEAENGESAANKRVLKDGFDLSSASSRFTLNILASVAKFETEVRAERIAAGIAAKKARGETWNNGRPKGSNRKATPEVRRQVMRMKQQG
jgi:DNA invertase Pin-like site-specific DNA recombinase